MYSVPECIVSYISKLVDDSTLPTDFFTRSQISNLKNYILRLFELQIADDYTTIDAAHAGTHSRQNVYKNSREVASKLPKYIEPILNEKLDPYIGLSISKFVRGLEFEALDSVREAFISATLNEVPHSDLDNKSCSHSRHASNESKSSSIFSSPARLAFNDKMKNEFDSIESGSQRLKGYSSLRSTPEPRHHGHIRSKNNSTRSFADKEDIGAFATSSFKKSLQHVPFNSFSLGRREKMSSEPVNHTHNPLASNEAQHLIVMDGQGKIENGIFIEQK